MLNKHIEFTQKDSQYLKSILSSQQNQQLQHGIKQDQHNILIDVPYETLTGITSHLLPPALLSLSLVNKRLYEHIKDDNTWCRAFVNHFLGIGPENNLRDDVRSLMLRKPGKSWKYEFVTRYNLRGRWERSRNVTTTHIPLHSSISSMHLIPPHSLLASSIQYGVVSRSLPLNGKVLAGYLDASGSRAGLGVGNPNAEFSPNVSSCAISSDGGTAKIIWGFLSGEVALLTSNKTMDQGKRVVSELVRCHVNEEHEGAVLDAIWDGEHVATGAADGSVKVWGTKPLRCIWSADKKGSSLVPDACIKVVVAVSNGCVVAGMRSGEIRVWAGLNMLVMSDNLLAPTVTEEFIIPCPVQYSGENGERPTAYDFTFLHIDPCATTPTILVAYEGDKHFYRLTIDKITRAMERTIFGDSSFGSISSLQPSFTADNAESSFVITGDHVGCVSVYAWKNTTHAKDPTASVNPIRKFEAHEDGSAVTSLFWNGFTLVTGSARGSTHVWDGLTLDHIRSFASPIPRFRGRDQLAQAERREREAVSQIIIGPEKDALFVCVGDRIMAWVAGPIPKPGKGGVRGRNTTGTLSKKKRSSHAKYIEQLEMNQTINELKAIIKDEREYAQCVHGREIEQRNQLTRLGLTEAEAIEYALMLSREEVPPRPDASMSTAQGSSHQSIFTPADQEVFEADTDEPSSVTGLNNQRRQQDYFSAYSSSSSLASNSSGENEVPICQPSSKPPEAKYHPRNVSPSGREAAYLMGSNCDESFPTMRTNPGSPNSRGLKFTTARGTGRNLHADASGSSGSVSPSGSSAWRTPLVVSSSSKNSGYSSNRKGGPRTSAASTEGPVELSGVADAAPIEMDADLKLAIELSLMEARSRGENI